MSKGSSQTYENHLARFEARSNVAKGLNGAEDILIWQKFKDGDESAFVYIYNTYFEDLCHFGVQYAQLPIVEDCIQDMFVSLRGKRGQLPDIKHAIRLYLFQALKRRILNVLKKKKPMFSDDLSQYPFEVIPPHESLLIINQSQKDKLSRLDQALRGLNEKQREVVYYFFYKGMSYEEVQNMMGYDHVKSARNMVYRIIKSLQKVFVMVVLCWPL
ncbi:sigma-70 family RNA polymerase sigma factor [Echinicola sp. CAU 1574]|uniref:Sigma-70 family RNA polymerase sigma factor n=1 Tax=Echinicola arenosa TaxID=2774144 RepID=A0ABR9AGA2_9BACT|nr:sigma-70 family RNA polymerase sigma factor [Echinicola arenosa]MBD8487768.1 sigma-70 family RNA polymerase sigma factor [Echinicola arenosa]